MARNIRYQDKLKLQKRKHFMIKVFFVSGITIVSSIVLIYVLFFVKLLDARVISFSGNTSVSNDELLADVNLFLDNKKFFIKKRNNLFLIAKDDIKKQLLDNFPKLESVEVTKDLSHTLNIKVQERSFVGFWCVGSNRCFYFDDTGIVYEEAPQTSGFLLLNIQDQRTRELRLGDRVESDEWIKSIFLARDKLLEKGYRVNQIIIPNESFDEFHAITSQGWRVMLSNNTDIPAQITAMASFLKQKLSTERVSTLEYVDLRIQDRIYYK